MLDGAVDFAESAAHAEFFLSDYSFHSFTHHYLLNKREQMNRKNMRYDIFVYKAASFIAICSGKFVHSLQVFIGINIHRFQEVA
jgi:hypothetical protein